MGKGKFMSKSKSEPRPKLKLIQSRTLFPGYTISLYDKNETYVLEVGVQCTGCHHIRRIQFNAKDLLKDMEKFAETISDDMKNEDEKKQEDELADEEEEIKTVK